MRHVVCTLVMVMLIVPSASAAVFQYAVPVETRKGERMAYLWIPPKGEKVRGVVMGGMTLMEREFAQDRRIRYACAKEPETSGYIADDHRPTLTLTLPQRGRNAQLHRLLIGMHDYESGLDPTGFIVTADFELDGVMAGENLAPQFMELPGNRWEWKMKRPVSDLKKGTLTIIARDRSGNVNRIVRTFSVGNRGTL